MVSDEEAKALQEIAKAASKYEEAVRELGTFVGEIIDHPAQQVGGLVGDLFKYARIELALRMKQRFERLISEQGVTNQKKVPVRLAYPILEAASVEDDDDIQDLFAQLLVNAVNVDSGVEVQKAFIEAVRSMSPLEAQILARLVDAPFKFKYQGQMIATAGLPDEYIEYDEASDLPVPPEPVAIAVSSLARNGCISAAGTWGGGTTVYTVSVTPFGEALMKACRPPKS